MSTPLSSLPIWQQRWPAPAKINRFLHIVGRKNDGYHLLQSVFQFVDFCDYLTFHPEETSTIHLRDELKDVAEKDNLIFKAAQLLQSFSQTKQGVSIQIEKNIPMGAGLGGGSSDAATTLVVLNKLWDCGLSIEQLTQLGIQLGADVAFFIHGRNAFVEGIGEIITPVQIDLPWILLAIPQCHIATNDIFSEPQLHRSTPKISLDSLIYDNSSSNGAIINLANYGHNDCQTVVSEKYPLVKTTINWLQSFSKPRLTGTGSCVFSLFNSHIPMSKLTPIVPEKITLMMAKTLQSSPLYTLLEKY